ncbi:hypothetical protein [Pelotomaculum propionicicum]|uniref:Uncharacterized protein n=1 Tax=Pelotomaculum propionicicum TaxID=258475 RepID=A0A4Y7RT59_9FIRM|nr:hypothetical protein [Pelotomaculum propionicicum]TEB12188.1 hypothetical protein Pmgp_01078 [Pelotomaculum propionicicum]
MIYFLLAVGILALFVIVFGVVGYFKSKRDYSDFVEYTLSKLPVKKADILEMKKAKNQYIVSFMEQGKTATKTFSAGEITILYDLKGSAKPYITFKSLKKDVPFPRVRNWSVKQGLYNVEVHVTEEYMLSI